MTPNHDQLYEVYELYLSNRKPGDPYWTFSGWLQHAGLSEKFPAKEVPIRAHCMGVEFPPRLPVSGDLGPMQRKCLAGPQAVPSSFLAIVSAITGVPEKLLVFNPDHDTAWRSRATKMSNGLRQGLRKAARGRRARWVPPATSGYNPGMF